MNIDTVIKAIKQDLRNIGINAFVKWIDHYPNEYSFDKSLPYIVVIFDTQEDMNLYSLVGEFKEDNHILRFGLKKE